MSSANIRAKIQRGLAKAVNKTGSSSSELVFLIKVTESTGGTPLNPATTTETPVLLVNAIFREYDIKLVDINIKAGDRELVSDHTVAIDVGETITQGSVNYIVINVENKAPTSDSLVYISQLRVK
jgi:hypothetical protein